MEDASIKKPDKYMKQETKSANSWLEELMDEKFSTGRCDEVPEGWITLTEMANQCSLPITTMNSKMMKLMKLGIIERKRFRVSSGRAISEVWHYNKK